MLKLAYDDPRLDPLWSTISVTRVTSLLLTVMLFFLFPCGISFLSLQPHDESAAPALIVSSSLW